MEITATTAAVEVPATRKMRGQLTRASNAPSRRVESTELRRELVETTPQTFPYRSGSYQAAISLDMAGHPAEAASSIVKFSRQSTAWLRARLNAAAVVAVIASAERKTRRPPSRSATAPLSSFPATIPAVPPPSTAPNMALLSPQAGPPTIAGLAA